MRRTQSQEKDTEDATLVLENTIIRATGLIPNTTCQRQAESIAIQETSHAHHPTHQPCSTFHPSTTLPLHHDVEVTRLAQLIEKVCMGRIIVGRITMHVIVGNASRMPSGALAEVSSGVSSELISPPVGRSKAEHVAENGAGFEPGSSNLHLRIASRLAN